MRSTPTRRRFADRPSAWSRPHSVPWPARQPRKSESRGCGKSSSVRCTTSTECATSHSAQKLSRQGRRRLDRFAAGGTAIRAYVEILVALRQHEQQSLSHRHCAFAFRTSEQRRFHPLERRPPLLSHAKKFKQQDDSRQGPGASHVVSTRWRGLRFPFVDGS